MELKTTLRETVDANRGKILAAVGEASREKKYLQGFSLPAEAFLPVIVSDFLETMVVCHESGSSAIFLEKLGWLERLCRSRKGGESMAESLLDFFELLKGAVAQFCEKARPEVEALLTEMEGLLRQFLQGEV